MVLLCSQHWAHSGLPGYSPILQMKTLRLRERLVPDVHEDQTSLWRPWHHYIFSQLASDFTEIQEDPGSLSGSPLVTHQESRNRKAWLQISHPLGRVTLLVPSAMLED